MTMHRGLLLIGLLGGFAARAQAQTLGYDHFENPPPNAYCSCEHYGSQYDGICAVSTWQPDNSTILSYLWTTYGNAWMPYPSNDNTAYYDSTGYGGLNVTLSYVSSGFYYYDLQTGQRYLWYPTGSATVTTTCGQGTVGWPN